MIMTREGKIQHARAQNKTPQIKLEEVLLLGLWLALDEHIL
jgi:hypothetical protein